MIHKIGGPVGDPQNWFEPNRAEPRRAGPSRAGPSRAGPGRAEPGRAEPSPAEPSQAKPIRAVPNRAEPGRAGGDSHVILCKNTSFYDEFCIFTPPFKNIFFYDFFPKHNFFVHGAWAKKSRRWPSRAEPSRARAEASRADSSRDQSFFFHVQLPSTVIFCSRPAPYFSNTSVFTMNYVLQIHKFLSGIMLYLSKT